MAESCKANATEERRDSVPLLDELVNRSLADIAHEVVRLRKENAELSDHKRRSDAEVAQLSAEVTVLRLERKDYKGAFTYLMNETQYFASVLGCHSQASAIMLPAEVLLNIFRSTRAPRYQQDPSVIQGPRGPWMRELRCRKGLVLVCKAWSGAATEALYEDIVLRRMGQIPALARVLTADFGPRRDLGGLVKTIRMDSCVVLPHCADSVHRALQTILQRCKALRAFEYRAHHQFPVVFSQPAGDALGGFNPAWFLHVPSPAAHAMQERCSESLRVLALELPIPVTQVIHLHNLLSASAGLQVLKLGPICTSTNGTADSDPGFITGADLPDVHLPKLRELYLYVDNHHFYAYVCERWRMPDLLRLTALNIRTVPFQLLAAHGSRLEYLHLYPEFKRPGAFDQTRWHGVPPCKLDCSELCPHLEHLAIAPQGGHLDYLDLTSTTLRYLDIWSPASNTTYWHAIFADENWDFMSENRDTLPLLSVVRRLYFPILDLPVICGPREDLREGDPPLFHRLPGMRLAQQRFVVKADVREYRDLNTFPPLPFPSDEDDDSRFWLPAHLRAGNTAGPSSRAEGGAGPSSDDASQSQHSDSEEEDYMSDSEDGVSEHESDCWQPDEQLDDDTVLTMSRASQECEREFLDTDIESDIGTESDDVEMA